MKQLLCRLVGHRWTWEGDPGATDSQRRCLRCDKRRPAWLLDGAVAPPGRPAWVGAEPPAARPARPAFPLGRGAALAAGARR